MEEINSLNHVAVPLWQWDRQARAGWEEEQAHGGLEQPLGRESLNSCRDEDMVIACHGQADHQKSVHISTRSAASQTDASKIDVAQEARLSVCSFLPVFALL